MRLHGGFLTRCSYWCLSTPEFFMSIRNEKRLFRRRFCGFLFLFFYIYFGDYLIRGDATIIAICMLAELTVAIMKGWIKLQKKVLVHLYGGFIIITSLSYGRMFKCYGDSVQEEILKKVVDSIYLFGSGIYYGHDGFQKPSSCFIDRPFGTYFFDIYFIDLRSVLGNSDYCHCSWNNRIGIYEFI